MKVTIFKNIKETSTPFIRDIDFILNRIKNGNSKDLINQIRNDKVNREQLKKNLPSICFSGIFKNRSVKGLLEHSGLICLDFDKYSDSNELVTFYNQLKEDEFTYACFISPSGDGIKLLVKIPAEVENHKLYLNAIKTYSPKFKKGNVPHNMKEIGSTRFINDYTEIKIKWMIDEYTQVQHTQIKFRDELIELLTNQVVDLTMMSKIELGDDVIAEIKRLKDIING